MISQKAKYALRALLALAEAGVGQSMQISDIADGQRIPRKFLEQILLDLKHRGLLSSRRGKNGGYALLRAPDLITVGEVLRLIDGPLAPLPCLSRMAYRRCEDCDGEDDCRIRRVFAEAHRANTAVLDATTLADMSGGSAHHRILGAG
ncbi:Rrf2 family transcriptional regulator [Roseospira marina]|uniref:Rrf2 family transcriptional regulator n=1 Tax=Roseospira marina TaxID=140057 RepID=A0A5M6I926_9PROT|nr:Rrf2 family transcriptional regulator [Roseospira marina]KAA5604249.1 Rrf2 family transcriptional regulator [Roseospira marina]MBB4315604.1 Rrf2 family protein [Roseospira marina]MBB5088600.1 Rrf2 family protein [Roseospira marina]